MIAYRVTKDLYGNPIHGDAFGFAPQESVIAWAHAADAKEGRPLGHYGIRRAVERLNLQVVYRYEIEAASREVLNRVDPPTRVSTPYGNGDIVGYEFEDLDKPDATICLPYLTGQDALRYVIRLDDPELWPAAPLARASKGNPVMFRHEIERI